MCEHDREERGLQTHTVEFVKRIYIDCDEPYLRNVNPLT